MTEQQWQVSTDPSEMYAFIKDRVTERQAEFITKELRCAHVSDLLGYMSEDMRAYCCDTLREIVPNPFRPMRWYEEPLPGCIVIVPMDCVILDPSWLTWNNATVPNLIRSMMEEECDECETGCVRCEKCNLTGYVPRAEPQWETMLLIADALEEAGCTEAAILDHLRGTEPCPCMNYEWRGKYECKICSNVPDESGCIEHGKGCYVVNEDGGGETYVEFDCECNGTGKHPVRHVRGCWCIELLKGASS